MDLLPNQQEEGWVIVTIPIILTFPSKNILHHDYASSILHLHCAGFVRVTRPRPSKSQFDTYSLYKKQSS
jgi:hypothetical protein